MSFFTIILFFLYTWGFGFTATKFLENHKNPIESNLIRVGIGLGFIPIIGVILGTVGIPLDWRIFLVLSCSFPLFILIKSVLKGIKPKLTFKLTKSNLNLLVLILIFAATFYMYSSGAFKYPWLEDDDPWVHANGVKYIATEKTIFEPIEGKEIFLYIDPYPPGYDLLMGILHQTSPSLNWTLKFFNALIISLGIIFFYIFVKEFTGNQNRALFSTFVLAAIPAYLSHFIWAHSLVITLFIVGLYCVNRIQYDKRWIYPSIFVIAGTVLTQPTQPIKYFIMFVIFILVKSIFLKKFQFKETAAVLGGYLLTIIWWATKWKAMFIRGSPGIEDTVLTGNIFVRVWMLLKKAFPYDIGTATRPYSFNDFFVAKPQNMINNPIGIGVIISLLVILSLIVIFIYYTSMNKDKKIWITIVLLWLLFTFLGVNSMTFNLPFGLFAFRFWMLLTIPVAIVVSEGLWMLFGISKAVGIPKYLILFLIIIGIFFTSAQQKFAVNTAVWNPGQSFGSVEEAVGTAWIATLPINTKIFELCSVQNVIGYDQFDCIWCPDEIKLKQNIKSESAESIHLVMKKKNYDYLLFNTQCVYVLGANETESKLNELTSSGKFQPVQQGQGFVVLKVL